MFEYLLYPAIIVAWAYLGGPWELTNSFSIDYTGKHLIYNCFILMNIVSESTMFSLFVCSYCRCSRCASRRRPGYSLHM